MSRDAKTGAPPRPGQEKPTPAPVDAADEGAAASDGVLATARAASHADGAGLDHAPPESTASSAADVDEPFAPGTDPGIHATSPPATEEQSPEVASAARLPAILESLIFASDRPLSLVELAEMAGIADRGAVEETLEALAAHYATRGIQLHAVAGGWQFRTDASNAPWVSRLLAHKPVRLTRAQLEVLAIVAYRQPITRPEIDEIRGVDSGGTLKTLLDRSLIRILGKKEEPGRPMLYGSTRDFLEFFNLRDLNELPTLREYHELTGEAQLQAPAQVLTQASAEPGEGAPGPVVPALGRVELAEDLPAELGKVDEIIQQATEKARVAEQRLATLLSDGAQSDGTAAASPGRPTRSE